MAITASAGAEITLDSVIPVVKGRFSGMSGVAVMAGQMVIIAFRQRASER